MSAPRTLITGGAGFVGVNLAHRLLSQGEAVVVLDDLSRRGSPRNVEWLRDAFGDAFELVRADVRDGAAVERAARGATGIFHFAAQVAVTTSLASPVLDFEVNARGTLNVLEAARRLPRPPFVLFTSTNKVYGALDDVGVAAPRGRYVPDCPELESRGIPETRPLDFHSPYGCSKGCADQYVIDYARCYGLPSVVFRMSCIYGPRQFGTEDQGWVSHFLSRALEGGSIALYGDGMQVRDLLFVDDLVEALLLARKHADGARGRAFNIGGGPENAVSLLDLISLVEELRAGVCQVDKHAARVGDQRYYVSDIQRFCELSGWRPRVRVREGVRRLHDWLVSPDGRRARA